MSSLLPSRTMQARVTRAYADQSSESAQEQMILAHLPLVRHIVQKVCAQINNSMDKEDLISAGTLGLVQAARGYDAGRDTEFKTYAYIRIRGAVLDEIRAKSFVPPGVHKQLRLVQKAYQRMTTSLGRPPEDEELAAELGVSVEQLYRTWQEVRQQHFLSIHGMTDEKPAYGQFLPAEHSPSPDDQAQRKELLERLTAAMQELPKRDRLILVLYYERDLTMKETAQVLGVTESRVSQLHASALFKLSMKLGTAP